MAGRFQGSGRFRKTGRDYSQLELFADTLGESGNPDSAPFGDPVARALAGAEETHNSASPETTDLPLTETPEPIAVIDAASQPQTEATNGRHEPVRRPDTETLDNPPAGIDRGTGQGEPVAAGPAPGSGTDGRSSLPSDGGSEDGVSRGLGAGDAGMGVPAERGPPRAAPPETAIIRQADPEPDPLPSRDFRITDADRIGGGSLRDKAFDNIEAIRTLKRIEAESRTATGAEKSLLVKYTGWGAMANAFRPYPPSEWQHTAAELHELLTPPEYESARASTPNAHYTSPMVIQAVWQAMLRFGLQPGAQILEPSIGVGHFLGLMPDDLASGSRRTGVELDAITARIAKCLYPDSTIFAKGLEETALPDNFFDGVIGNIPFG